MPFCVGLTGGIGCGKSTATDIFRALGAAVVDTDELSHELTRSGGAAIAAIRNAFGMEYIAADGSLDRARMRKLVFAEPEARHKLEAILHPLIRAASYARIAAAQQPYVLVVVPLLFETGAYRELVARVVVVDCDEILQIARTVRRSGLTDAEVRAIMATQVPREKRLAAADDVLHNDGDVEALRRQVEALHAKYLALAAKPPEATAVPTSDDF
ncbi:MAG: dephospho-CoA kinase [Betaproteobacteria bacterium]|nr:dephospho-CoA kinase [Betaproteobacteria bacterium]